MTTKSQNDQIVYFDLGGQPYSIPLSNEKAIRSFVNNPQAKQITEREAAILFEAGQLEEQPILGRAEALARGVASGATVGLSALAMDPIEEAAAKEAFPGAFLTGDIGAGVTLSALTLGAGAKARVAVEGAKQVAKRSLAREVLDGARKAAKFTPAGLVTRVGQAAAKVPLSLQGTNALSAATRSIAPFAIQGAVEGAAAGFGYGIADKYLENPDATAQDLMSSGLDSGVGAGVIGAGIPLGLTGLKTAAAAGTKGASKIAKSIYGAAANAYGETFSNSLSRFIASETPEVQAALASELQQVLQFGQTYSMLRGRIDALAESAEALRAQGLEMGQIRKEIAAEVKGIKKDIRSLNTGQVKQARNKINALVGQAKQETTTALKQGEKELVDLSLKPLSEAGDALDEALNRLGDSKVRVSDDAVEEFQLGELDDAIFQLLDRDIKSGQVKTPNELAEAMMAAQTNSAKGFRAVANSVTDKQAKQELLSAATQIENFHAQINKKFPDLSLEDLQRFYFEQRQLLRRLYNVPSSLSREGVPGAEKLLSNKAITAYMLLSKMHKSENLFGRAAKLELAADQLKAPMIGFRNRVKAAGTAKTVEGVSKDVVEYTSDVNEALGNLAAVAEDVGGENMKRQIMGSLSTAKEGAEKAQLALARVADYQKATGQVKALKQGADTVDLPDLPAEKNKERIELAYRDLNEALSARVDDVLDPEAAQALAEKEILLDLRQQEAQRLSRQSPEFQAERRRRAEAAGATIVDDSNLEQLLRFRSAPDRAGFGDVAALTDLFIGVPFVPDPVSLAYIGANRLKGQNLGALRSISKVAEAVRKTDENINRAADWALNAAVEGKKPDEFIKGTSILGKILGVSIGKNYKPGEE